MVTRSKKNRLRISGDFKFSDENGKASDGKLIQYIFNSYSAKQYEHFVADKCFGITKAGQARLNQSIESMTYCILGSQVDLRSSIFCDIGSAKEVQREFLNVFESVIIQNDLSKSIKRFELSIQEAKVKLNLAISPGCWLMASDVILNKESKTSYNNFLRHASHSMHLGLNSDVNNQTKVIGIRHNLGESRVKLLSHKEPRVKHKDTEIATKQSEDQNKDQKTKDPSSHEINIAVMTVLAGVVIYLLFKR